MISRKKKITFNSEMVADRRSVRCFTTRDVGYLANLFLIFFLSTAYPHRSSAAFVWLSGEPRPSQKESSCINVENSPKSVKKILINFSMKKSHEQQENCRTGLSIGRFDSCRMFRRSDLNGSSDMYSLNFLNGEGNQWVWKPLIIFKALLAANDDDIVWYSDQRAKFIGDVSIYLGPLISRRDSLTERPKKYLDFMIAFENELSNREEYRFSKRDAFVIMNADHPTFVNSPQISALNIAFRKSPEALFFVSTWAMYTNDARVTSDGQNVINGSGNYPGFIRNEHEQTALSLLAKKWAKAQLGVQIASNTELQRKVTVVT